MELIIYAPQEADFLKEISFNNEQIKEELAIRLEKYNGLVYSEQNIKEAKSDRATLNTFKKAVDDRRIQIKKQILIPYDEFEKKVKEIVAMIDKPILAIDTQVKGYEQVKKDEKLAGIKAFYTDKVGDLAKLVPFDKIYNEKWMNATYKGSDIEKEIQELFCKVESDLQVLGELQLEPQLKDFYLKNFDLTGTLQEKKRMEAQAEKMAEYNKQQAEKKAQELQRKREQEAEKKAQELQRKREQEAAAFTPSGSRAGAPMEVAPELSPQAADAKEAEFETPQAKEPVTEQVFPVDFRVWATKNQLMALKQFLVDNGIKYGKA